MIGGGEATKLGTANQRAPEAPGALVQAATVMPALLATGLFLVWAASEAGYPAITWYPGALFLLGLLLVVAVSYRRRIAVLPRALLVALFLLGAFCVWSFVSIGWAGVKGDAWDGANRTLLYFTVFALFAVVPWRGRIAGATLGAFAVATAAIGAAVLLEAGAASEPETYFTGGRFAEPAGYANANCALWLAPFWPSLYLASRAETPWPARGLLLGAAGLLLQLGLLTQSRGSLFAVPVVAVAYFALVPGRARSAVFLLPVLAATLLALDPILDVWSTDIVQGDLAGALDAATTAMGVSLGVLVLTGALAGIVDRSIEISERVARRGAQAIGLAAAVAAIVGIALFLTAVGDPVRWTSERWDDFTAGQEAQLDSSRFSGGLGSNRYDFWRVGLAQFADSPVVGTGADNFAVEYVRRRRSDEEPLYPHSVEVRTLAQTGAIGAVLLGGFLILSLVAAARARVLTDPFTRGVAAVAVVTFGYWLVHGSGDWFWEFPALGAPAFGWLAMSGALAARASPSGHRHVPMAARVALAIALTAAVLVAATSYALPLLAAKHVERAAEGWSADSAGAFRRLESARGLNFLSDRPDLVAGAIASRLGQRSEMRAAFMRALERNPDNWYAHLELGVVDALDGRRASALQRLERASALNPHEPVLASVLRDVMAGKRVSPDTVDRAFLRRVE